MFCFHDNVQGAVKLNGPECLETNVQTLKALLITFITTSMCGIS